MGRGISKLALFLLPLLVGVSWADTVSYENRKPAPGKPIGWSYKVPDDWKAVAMPEKLSEGHKNPDESQWVLVTWSENELHDQMAQLVKMGFTSEDARLAGRSAWRLERRDGGRYDRMIFVRFDDGWIRLALGSKAGSEEVLGEIEKSFNFLAIEVVGWADVKGPGFHCSLPSSLRTETRQNGLAVLDKDGEVALITKHPLEKTRSLRAFARGYLQAELADFQPFETKAGLSSYLTSWKTTNEKKDERVLAFIPLNDGSVLVVEPKKREAITDVPRWLKSFR